MASMRDKLEALIGKKIRCNGGSIISKSYDSDDSYHKIIEVGEDYFIVDMFLVNNKRSTSPLYPITYAINEVKSIQGGL